MIYYHGTPDSFRKLTYISAMRAYSELRLEHKKSPDWMQKSFE